MSTEPEFADLPAALVEEMLSHASQAGDLIAASLNKLSGRKAFLRRELERQELVLRDSSFGFPPFPTTCGVDGSFGVERLLSVDLVAAVALAVEGFEPPGAGNPWNAPRHELFTAPEPHDMQTSDILRALMIGSEVILAAHAPHEVVMLDMALAFPFTVLAVGVPEAAARTRLRSSLELLSKLELILQSYAGILSSARTDRQYAGLPKYTSRHEIGRRLPGRQEQDDRALLTAILEAGELTAPLPLDEAGAGSFSGDLPGNSELREAVLPWENLIRQGLGDLRVFYYRPHDWLPALRVEVPGPVALNPGRMALVLQGLKHQCSTSVMLEPYPLYMADRMAKTIARSLPAFRQIALREVSQRFTGETEELFFSLHGYRSEGGQ